jgi:exonuclease SbcC
VRREERAALADDLGLLEELREAFSKRGVPAMIIETVVPELERSANELLTRMTEGRLHVRIETQREIKSGELREALDIIISDELGSRPYELYSGGEAFRINFAIRIALSKLLANRAGAQLRSLFIDEGFGTQDEQGRAELVEAINSVEQDFDRVLVITHIEELKDAFPTRIEVRKTPTGSEFSLN